MIIDNLKARCVDSVARDLARGPYYSDRVSDNSSGKTWHETIAEYRPAAAAKINEMSNMELLDLISEILVND